MDLDTKLNHLAGIGPSLSWRLAKLELLTVEDLIKHFPFRYDDFSNTKNVLDAKIGERVTLQGEIWSIKNVYTRTRKILTQAIFNDGTSPITLTWFNQSWLTKQIQSGDKLQISGKVSKYKNKLNIIAPVWEKTPDVPSHSTPGVSLHTGRLVPIYPETFGLTSKWIRAKIAQVLPKIIDEIKDPFPKDIKKEMVDLPEAIKQIHFPEDYQKLNRARERLSFDEMFFIQLATQKTRLNWQKKEIVSPLNIKESGLKKFLGKLPFELTSAQKKVLREIIDDLQKPTPMNRLVQGEVGSGKTVVAAAISYLVIQNKLKVLFMAPTEILAFQHYSTLTRLLTPFGIEVGIYTGSRKFSKGKGKQLHPSPLTLNPSVVVGTHALLSEKLNLENIGLIIVDEQQRFGVGQRTLLRNKASVPHFLTMTATPIPRTVALTLYGDLDLSVIDELPKGRIPIKTHFVPSKKRADAYFFLEKKVREGDQVYIITPLIEESETLKSAKAAKVEFERLKKQVFPDLKLGLLHGRLKSKEKEEVLDKFKNGQLDILVSTSVVEVGVDVTNATIMVIEGAERFGLSQLHQLRGRIGRGFKESFCFLFSGQEDSQTISRIKNLEKINDGLKLAELDLKIRGSGEIFGIKQSGRFELKIASFSDLTLLEKTRSAARELLYKDPSLDSYPLIKAELAKLASNVMPD